MKNKTYPIVFGGALLIFIFLIAGYVFTKSPDNTQTPDVANATAQTNVENRNKTSIPAGDVGQLATMALQVHDFE